MPVVIREFEVVEQSPRQVARAEDAAGGDNAAAAQIDALELQEALRTLQADATRVWAH